MSARRSFVTGGTGYVGRFIVEGLLDAGHEVTVMGRSAPADGFFSRPVGFAPFSLEPEGIAPALLRGADHLVHAAFDHLPGRYRGGEGDDPVAFRRRNLRASIALFEAAKAAGVRRVVFLSSRAVYGPRPPGEWLDEADDARPDTLYGEVKLAAEQALNSLQTVEFSVVSLRITGVYGPTGPGRAHKWAGLFADYLAGHSITPRAATEVHGRDVAAAVRLVLELPQLAHPVLNVSDIVADRRDILAIVKGAAACAHPLPGRADKGAVNAMRTNRLGALGWRPGGRDLLEKTVLELLDSPAAGFRK